MADSQWLPRIAADLCNGCGECIQQCPTGALGWQNGKAALVQPDRCTYSANCERVCPVGAIDLPYLIVKSLGATQYDHH
ncbi:MAG: 4Fe-4S binding protein [Chloroflexi bacterium]|nr:4Fe-4S binding protein [Chloroflexota bacterium]